MPDEIQDLKLIAREHELRLNSMEKMTTEGIAEQRQLVRELHALTSKFDVYIERHDQVSESNKRLWDMLQHQSKDIAILKDTASANQPVIDGIRNLNSKLIWLIVSAVFAPTATIGAAIVFKVVP